MKYKLLALAILVGIWVTKQLVEVNEVSTEPKVLSQTEEILVLPDGEATKQIEKYGYAISADIDAKSLRLIPNYEQKLPTKEIVEANNCQQGINGGFYDTENKPLGLLTVKGVDISRRKTSSLFNGFVNLDSENLTIDESPASGAGFVMQSGPILVKDGQPTMLSMARDKPARRMVLGNTKNGKVFFLSVFDNNIENLGPYLQELPPLVAQIAQKENLELGSAINMDGGQASAFYAAEMTIVETEPVGSFWCATGEGARKL